MESVKNTGDYVKKELRDIEIASKGKIENIRGKGTFIAFDTKASIFKQLRNKGILTVPLSANTIAIRPSLTLTTQEIHHFLYALRELTS